ncbi:MAG: putative peptidoglycan glycosyltransferase FtsW [Phycisphaerae bacterium]
MTAMPQVHAADAPAFNLALVRTRYDAAILYLVGALMVIGVVMVYSASISPDAPPLDWSTWWRSPLKQCAFAAVGFAVMLLASQIPHRVFAWERSGDGLFLGVLLGVTAAALLALQVPSLSVGGGGARRALPLGVLGLTFQPAEFAKVLLIVWTSALLTRPGVDSRSLTRTFLPALASAGLLIGLTGLEDFGTAALMGVVLMSLLLCGGVRWTHLVGLAALGAAAGAYLVYDKPYRLERIHTFFADAPDAANEGYQVTQSLYAIGSGGLWGVGLGQGVQKFDYLPQADNDFIYAIVCEELGIVGGLVIVALFLALLWRGARIAHCAEDAFGRLLAIGFTLLICLQAAFNLAVVTDSIPTKGISLPFVSAGGSGVLFLGMAAGMLAAIGRPSQLRERDSQSRIANSE